LNDLNGLNVLNRPKGGRGDLICHGGCYGETHDSEADRGLAPKVPVPLSELQCSTLTTGSTARRDTGSTRSKSASRASQVCSQTPLPLGEGRVRASWWMCRPVCVPACRARAGNAQAGRLGQDGDGGVGMVVEETDAARQDAPASRVLPPNASAGREAPAVGIKIEVHNHCNQGS
jgi:hypothetical protein